MFFQPIPTKDKITFTNKEGNKETGTKIRFRNGFCSEVLTSVDIQQIVKAGGRIIKIVDGIVYEENFKTPPYRDYILILRDLNEKKRKRCYSKDKISVEDYIRLASGHDVTNEFKKVVIPKDDDRQKKVFRSYLNLVKRKAPDDEGIRYPYGDKDDLSLDENYEFDDCDYLTIQEENEDC
ncbi:hypothetical protein LOTGIDRAFT_176230 [Lottia gigantea]|uniref:Uncharacterized protein n=1 Tax=Lottia gigantea TaxID=225164 RepID=V3ZH44_LOTGI|nr:hypothetical protein LOTGIDRAFT_176230 [Lottia gigantea]ESO83482.1 hypothetical protein LOTGIDRAFT_176230 [Lottia gigantea]